MARDNTVHAYEGDEHDQVNTEQGRVTRNFLEHESLSSEATDYSRKRTASNDAEYLEESVNNALYEEQLQAVALEEIQEATRRSILNRQRVVENQRRLVGIKTKARAGLGMARLGTATGAVIPWFFQMLAGAASLAAFGGQGSIDYFLNETLAGRVINATVGYFFDLHSFIPFDALAIAFWGIATIIALGTFIVYLLFFYFTSSLTGAKLFDSAIDYLIAAVVFALCILPVGNLLPSVLVWVVYVNVSMAISAIRVHPGRSGTMGGV